MCDYESYLPDDIRLSLEDNPVHTLLYLSGSEQALQQASDIIHRLNKGIMPKGQVYIAEPDSIKEESEGDSRWFEIVFDNHVPQIYEKLTAIEGLKRVIFAVYSSFDTFMNTNDAEGVIWKRREMFGIPTDLEVELVDDYPDTFDHASFNYKIT